VFPDWHRPRSARRTPRRAPALLLRLFRLRRYRCTACAVVLVPGREARQEESGALDD